MGANNIDKKWDILLLSQVLEANGFLLFQGGSHIEKLGNPARTVIIPAERGTFR